MELGNKKVLVVGLARTGIECAHFLVNQGAKVSVSDLRSETDLIQELDALKVADSLSFRGGRAPLVGGWIS
jgi:UDP-N-acetylmuramoylalanine--D-glutamate ligase